MQEEWVFDTAFGPMRAREKDGALCALAFCSLPPSGRAGSGLMRRVKTQMDEYFAGVRQVFDLPLAPEGTAFQKQVWQALLEIPYGETRSYGQLAAALNNPRACRAVGSANGKNPLVVVVPCHRVVRSGGALGGYAYGTALKSRLLQLENIAY